MTTKVHRCAVWVLVALLSGCKVILISDYDPETDQRVTALQDGVAQHLARLAQLATADRGQPKHPDCEYAQHADTYAGLAAEVHTLIVRNEARDKNELTVEQLKALADSLTSGVPALHQAAEGSCMTADTVATARALLDQNFRAILKLELAKKSYREEK